MRCLDHTENRVKSLNSCYPFQYMPKNIVLQEFIPCACNM
jgi:hypothetical protein